MTSSTTLRCWWGELHPADRERVILSPARFSERELTTLSERIWEQRDELRALGSSYR